MSESAHDPESFNRFFDFINRQLDLSGLDDSASGLSEDEIERMILPLIRDDIVQETLRAVAQLVRHPQRDHWRAQLAPLHREVRQCLATTVGGILERRYPGRLDPDEWRDVATLVITVAWLVRKQIDGDDTLSTDN